MTNIKKIFISVLGIVSASSFILATGVNNSSAGDAILSMCLLAGFTSLAVALFLYNLDSVRRITYPAAICAWAWLYDHRIIRTRFSSSSYRIYRYFGGSYKKLFYKVQEAFDQYVEVISGE